MRIRSLSLQILLSAGLFLSTATSRADDSQQALRNALFKRPALAISEPRTDLPTRLAPAFTPVLPPLEAPDLARGLRELAAQPAGFTPYDRYLGSVRTVLERSEPGSANMMRACRVMKQAHAFRYRRGDPYHAATPATTSATRAGDCKAKALWLYDQLGDSDALYVIGKASRGARSSHAWVLWRFEEQWWILDPTNRGAPIAAASLPETRYVPYYSFGKAGAFRHRATRIFMANTSSETPAVTDREAGSETTSR